MPIFSRSATSAKSPTEAVKTLVDGTTKIGKPDLKEKDKERELETVHRMLLHLKVNISLKTFIFCLLLFLEDAEG